MPQKKPVKKKTSRRDIPAWWVAIGVVLLVTAVLLIFFLSGLSERVFIREQTPTPTLVGEIDVDRAYQVFAEQGVVFLDVRTAQEFKAYRIARSVNIPLTELSRREGELSPAESIYIFDRIGGEPAMRAYASLKQGGFTRVFWVSGGMDAWVQKRYPFIGTAPY